MELLTTSIIAVAIVVTAIVAKRLKNKRRLPPGPSGWTFYSDFIKAVFTQSTYKQFGKWARKYGDVYSLSLPGQTIVVLNSVKSVKDLFLGETRNVTNNRPPSFLGRYFLKNAGITFSSVGSTWRKLRQLFHTSINLHVDGGKSIENTLRSELLTTVSRMQKTDDDDDGNIDLYSIVSDYLMTVLHMLIAGERPPPGSPNLQLMRDLDRLMNKFLGLDQEAVLSNLPFLRHLPNGYRRRWVEINDIKRNLHQIFYKDYKKNFQSGVGIIDKLMEAMSADGSLVTEDHVQALILELIGAGYVTSKSTLVAMLLMTIEKREVQAQIHKEIDSVLGERPPSIKDQADMPYIEACLMEIMRYTGHLPTSIPHMAETEFEYNGWTIPEGSVLLPNLFHINHDNRIWEDPWEFKPERFLGSDGHLLDPIGDVRQRILAFGIGKRTCPGQNFAKSRMFMLMATIFQRFELLPPENKKLPSSHPSDWDPALILMPSSLYCRVKRRQVAKPRGM